MDQCSFLVEITTFVDPYLFWIFNKSKKKDRENIQQFIDGIQKVSKPVIPNVGDVNFVN